MSKEQKRLRQISIFQSFDNCKKPRQDKKYLRMEHNAFEPDTVVENRLKSPDSSSIQEHQPPQQPQAASSVSQTSKQQTSELQKNLHDLLEAAENSIAQVKNKMVFQTQKSPESFQIDRRKAEESEEEESNSQELFPSSEELLPGDSEQIEECSSQKSTDSIQIGSLSCRELSQELFPDDEDINIEEVEEVDSSDDELTLKVNNQLMSLFNRKPDCSIPLPELEPLENHSIMISPHIRDNLAPRPYPGSFRDRWDFNHVRMPCSPQNRYPVEDLNGEKVIRSRWALINQSLRRNIQSPSQLEDAVMCYNSQYRGKWNFTSFHAFFNECFSDDELSYFFEGVLPAMINMALDLPNICTQAIPLLKKKRDHSITMSQKQVACLLLNAFFCTFPRRNSISKHSRHHWSSEYASYPDINFNRLFYGIKNKILSTSIEKLKCLINYFRRVISQEPTGTITFHRKYFRELPKWKDSTFGLQTVAVKSDGLIESDGCGMLQVDFANKFVGGGVLGHGCVQEEIRFVICPELIVSRLFVESLGPTEVLLVTGVEQYNKYSGYSDTFLWKGSFKDQTPRDAWGRRITEVVAMDATHFTNVSDQFKSFYIEKELTKAYCGFHEDAPENNLSAVATGNWGCGAFNGNPAFKFLIQYMAASHAKRELLYFTFGNKTLEKELKKIYHVLSEKNLSVGDLWRILHSYSQTVRMIKKEPRPKMYDFLCSIFTGSHIEQQPITTAEQSSPQITASDEMAMAKLIQDVENENSETEMEDNEDLLNDHG